MDSRDDSATCQCTHFSSFAVLVAYCDMHVTLRGAAFSILMWSKFSHV